MADGGNTVPALTKAEHIGSAATGDNIEAKRVANYGFGTQSAWSRVPAPFINVAFDEIAFSNADANGNYQTITFKDTSSTVRTLSLAFDGSNNVTNITRT